MKRNIIKSLAFATMLSLTASNISLNAFARTYNHLTKEVRIDMDTELDEETAPSLFIGASDDHTEDFSFEVYLDNAAWSGKYEDDGTLVNGISYTRLSDTKLLFNVDIDVFDAESEDIEIPVYAIPYEAGSMYVGIDSKQSTVSSGEYLLGVAGFGQLKFYNEPVENMEENSTINDIKIEDDFNASIKARTKYTIKLKGGFAFLSLPTVDETGKYSGKIDIDFANSDRTAIVLTVNSDTSAGDGTINLSDIEIDTDNASYGDIKAEFTSSAGGSTDLNLGTFGGESLTPSEIKINKDIDFVKDNAYISGKATEGKILKLTIDGEDYGQTRVDVDGDWQFEVDKTIFEDEKTHIIQVGYVNADSNELVYSTKTEYNMAEDRRFVEYTIDESGYIANGTKVETDGVSYIDGSGRTMIPLRTFSNSMGIPNEDIAWNGATGEVSIDTPFGYINLKIGSTKMTSPNGDITLESPAVIKNDRTYIPLRAVLNAYGIDDDHVVWSSDERTVKIFLD